MPPSGLYGFPECAAAAERLARALQVPFHMVELHRFPDGESLVRLPQAMKHAALYRALDHPNDKLVEIVLAAEALREQGAEQVTLVAPYLPYMRQDAVFQPGEPISQKVVGRWLADHFTTIVAVDPHLHRTEQLSDILAGAEAIALTAAGLFVEALRKDGIDEGTVIIGPDEEAGRLAKGVAEPLGLAWGVASKKRKGDRRVDVTLPKELALAGRAVVIVDDVVSSGVTLLECMRAAQARGARSFEALIVHALCDAEVERALKEAGLARLRSCDGVPHRSNAFELAPLLAGALAG